MSTQYDVVIIGAGISGACIARELSKTQAKVCMLDKEDDVSCGTSKANSGIVHAGYDPMPGTLMARLNVRGAALMPELAKKLNFDYNPIGSLVLAFDEDGMKKVQTLYERGLKNGVKDMAVLNQDELRALEPNINEEAVGALFAKTAGIIAPYQATWAIAESAVINGVEFMRDTMVHAITKNEDGTTEENAEVSTPKKDVKIKKVTVDTFGEEYGKPETLTPFNYMNWLYSQYGITTN